MAKLYWAKSKLFQEYGIPDDMVCIDIELDSPHIEYMDTARRTHCTFFKYNKDRRIEVVDRWYDEKTDRLSKENVKITKETANIINEFLRREHAAIKMLEWEMNNKPKQKKAVIIDELPSSSPPYSQRKKLRLMERSLMAEDEKTKEREELLSRIGVKGEDHDN